MLPLPAGETVETFDMALLLRYAARAVAVSRSLQRPVLQPHRSVEIHGLYDLPDWQPWKNGGYPLYSWPYRIHALAGGHSFLVDARKPALFSMHGTYAYQFDIFGFRKSLAWGTQDNGKTIDVALVYGGRHTTDK